MKNNLGFLILLFIIVPTGCASFGTAFYHEPHEITREDADKVHPHSRHQDTHKRLTLEESQLINTLYGEEINREGDLIVYYNARHMKPLFPLTKGNIFLVKVRGETDDPLIFLVCTTKGKVDEVILKNNPIVKGKPLVSNEFLRQFIGRSLGHSWEIVKDPSDLLSLPRGILPISDYPKTSKEAAEAFRKVLVWAKALRIE